MPTTTQQKNIAIESVSLDTRGRLSLSWIYHGCFLFFGHGQGKRTQYLTRFCVQKEATCVLKSWYRSISTCQYLGHQGCGWGHLKLGFFPHSCAPCVHDDDPFHSFIPFPLVASLHQLPLFCRLLGGRFDHKFSLSTTTYGLSVGELDFLIQAQLLQLGSDIGKGWELSRVVLLSWNWMKSLEIRMWQLPVFCYLYYFL